MVRSNAAKGHANYSFFSYSTYKKEATHDSSAECYSVLLNSSAIAYQSAKAIRSESAIDNTIQDGVTFNSDKEAFDYVERMIEAVFLAFTGLEAFVNDIIPDDFIYARHKQSDVILETANKSNIERHAALMKN